MEPSRSAPQIEQELKKRLQEMECSYNIGALLRSDAAPDIKLRDSAQYLSEAMQYPEIASASVYLDGREYAPRPVPREQVAVSFVAEIVTNSQRRGSVEVYYQKPFEFLEEEKRLIRETALRISKGIEVQNLSEELTRYVGRLQQLVDEKATELQRSKKRYENMFKSAPVPMLISRPNGDIAKANRAFYKLVGYPEDGSVQLNFVRDKLYQDPGVRRTIYKKLVQNGEIDGYEFTMLDRSGTEIEVIGSYGFVDYDGEQCIESVYKDISAFKELERKLIEQKESLEQKVRERTLDLESQKDLLVNKNQELRTLTEKLRVSKTRLQTLFNAITDTVVVIDRDFNILMSNQKRIGNKGKCFKKVLGLEDPCEDCLVERVFREKTSITQEKQIDDEYYLLQAYPIFDSEEKVIGALEISRVITKEKNLERQLLQADKLASLGQLVSGVAHEINNPNQFIHMNLSFIQEAMNDIIQLLDRHYPSQPNLKIARLNYDVFKENMPVLMDDMVQGSDRIKGIVDGLRKFAKRDEGLLNEVASLNDITEACLRLVDNQIARNAEIKVELEPDMPFITGNTQKLQQVIVNILINASQAIEKSRGIIRVTTSHNDKEAILRVQDDGKGMDQRTIKQIFDPFFTTKRHQGGTGLGLSIAYGIIKEHKGRIDVESKVGMGTTFSIYLPYDSTEAQ